MEWGVMSNIEQQWQGFVPEFVEGIVYRDHKHLIIRNIANALSALALWASVGFTWIELVQKCPKWSLQSGNNFRTDD